LPALLPLLPVVVAVNMTVQYPLLVIVMLLLMCDMTEIL